MTEVPDEVDDDVHGGELPPPGAAGVGVAVAPGDDRLQRKELSDPSEARARQLAGGLALALQGALLVRHGDAAVADAFVASRLADSGGPWGWGHAFGTLPTGIDTAAIISRVTPAM
jgi:hypothetical protein